MIIVAMAAMLAANAEPKVDKWAEVNGARYRVTIRGETFVVNKKAMVVRDTIEERDAQRQAVRIATGCEPIDELQRSARLRGKLACPR